MTPAQARTLAALLRKEGATLRSLCGNAGDETHLDMSREMWGCPDAVMLAAEIRNNQELTSLNVSENGLCGLDHKGMGEYDNLGVGALLDAVSTHTCVLPPNCPPPPHDETNTCFRALRAGRSPSST